MTMMPEAIRPRHSKLQPGRFSALLPRTNGGRRRPRRPRLRVKERDVFKRHAVLGRKGVDVNDEPHRINVVRQQLLYPFPVLKRNAVILLQEPHARLLNLTGLLQRIRIVPALFRQLLYAPHASLGIPGYSSIGRIDIAEEEPGRGDDENDGDGVAHVLRTYEQRYESTNQSP